MNEKYFHKNKKQKKVNGTSKSQEVIGGNNYGIYEIQKLVNGNDKLQNYSKKLNVENISRNKQHQNLCDWNITGKN